MASSRIPRIGLDDVGNLRASRTPGPLGYNDAASPCGPNKPSIGDSPSPLGINDHGPPDKTGKMRGEGGPTPAAKNWDPLAAAAYLKDPGNGWAGISSKGRCARAVRLAINAGHVATPANPISAADYKDYLARIGFKAVQTEGYAPRIGDIAVFPAVPGSTLIHGHIEKYTGEGWQSDYVQQGKPRDGKYGKGFFANNIWASRPFTIFRKGE